MVGGNVETSLADSIIHGPNGVADSVSYHNGTTMTLYAAVTFVLGGLFFRHMKRGFADVL